MDGIFRIILVVFCSQFLWSICLNWRARNHRHDIPLSVPADSVEAFLFCKKGRVNGKMTLELVMGLRDDWGMLIILVISLAGIGWAWQYFIVQTVVNCNPGSYLIELVYQAGNFEDFLVHMLKYLVVLHTFPPLSQRVWGGNLSGGMQKHR